MRILIDGQTFETEEFNRGIGIYMRNVLNRMLKISLTHEWYIYFSDKKSIQKLDQWMQNKLHVIVSPDLMPGTDYTRGSRFTQTIQHIVDQYNIDVIWNPNPLMTNVLFIDYPLSCKMIVTVHDLIPKIFPPADWPESVAREYQRRLEMIRDEKSIYICMDSESTKKDWIRLIDDQQSSIRVIPLSADAGKFYCRRQKVPSVNPFILYTGGFDYRKNLDGAIEAFSQARRLHSNDVDFLKYKLVIIGSSNEQSRKHYEQIVVDKNLTGQVVFTGFVSENRLIELYREADLFFFPSKYEGFGLPLLEAMLSGDYIVSADNSSLPEVCGPFATYFSVDDPERMAESLYLGYLAHMQETEDDIHKRQEHALNFSWDQTAISTLEFMESTENGIVSAQEKPSLAIFTPWPDQKTGIANYEYMIIPYLAKYFRITVFTATPATERKPLKNVEVADLDAFRKSRKQFDFRLFQIGNNNLYHKEIMDLLMHEGGIAEIHDYVLTPFFFESYFRSGETKKYRKLLQIAYGRNAGNKLFRNTVQNQRHPDILEYPMSEAVVAISEKVIVHNAWSANKLHSGKTGILPLPSFPIPIPDESSNSDNSFLIETVTEWKKQGYTILGCLGWINPNKQPRVVIEALRKLKEEGLRVKLVFWGENKVETLQEIIYENEVTDNVLISGYLNKEQYYRAIRLTDIIVNLRHPSMGESSGPLCESFQMKKAVIVSDLNQYREYPDEVCWKLPVDNLENETLVQYIKHLITHPEVRQALEENAGNYADYTLSPIRIAKQYYNFITKSR